MSWESAARTVVIGVRQSPAAGCLSTVRAADRILVLSQGRLVGEGTHESLLRSSELYRQLATQLTTAE